MSELSRRNFLKGSALAAAGAATLGLAACSPSNDGADSGAGGSWDKEVDVLVVGSGTVACAALVAAANGAESVLIIEKSAVWGGTTATSGETLWIPLFYAGQEAGMNDTREDALTYMKLCAAGRGDEKAMEVYIDNGNAFIEWTREEFGWNWTAGTPGAGFKDYYEPFEGYRSHGRQASLDAEERLWAVIRAKLEELGTEIMMETPATSLITDESGAVIGVTATSGGSDIRIKANTVVLGTGGFDHNPEMVRANQFIPLYVTNAVQTNTGDAQLMAQAIGAELANMDGNWGLPAFYDETFDPNGDIVYSMTWPDWGINRTGAGSIIVNKRGKRFANESSAYAVFNRAYANYHTGTLEFMNIPAVWIADSNYALGGLPGQGEDGALPDNIFQADSLAEIAEHFGIDAANLEATVAEFNKNAVEGKDPDFQRGEKEGDRAIAAYRPYKGGDIVNPTLAPVATPPFYASLYVPGTCGTNGGVKTNEFAQALNTKGEVIPNLYAVGNCASSISGSQYCGAGMTVGAGSVMSWVAIRTAMGLS